MRNLERSQAAITWKEFGDTGTYGQSSQAEADLR